MRLISSKLIYVFLFSTQIYVNKGDGETLHTTTAISEGTTADATVNDSTEATKEVLTTDETGNGTTIAGIVTNATAVNKRRPFYNIAHMVNSLAELDFYLAEGANAIETDVTFLESGKAEFVYHGGYCDYWRICDETEKLEVFLEKIKELSTPGNANYVKSFVLQLLDLKLKPVNASYLEQAGATFARVIVKHLFDFKMEPTQLKLLIGIFNSGYIDFVIGFQDELLQLNSTHLNDRIGFDFGGFEDVLKIRNAIAQVPGIKNIWFNDGITNYLSYLRGVGRLRDALRLRDTCNSESLNSCPKKVYHWTIDLPPKLRSSLRLQLDGILTNNPALLNQILAEKPFVDQFRLADVNDDPFEYFVAEEDSTSQL